MAQSYPEQEHGAADAGRLPGLGEPVSVSTPERTALAMSLMAMLHERLIVLDRDLCVVAASPSYLGMFPAAPANARKLPFGGTTDFLPDSGILDLLRSVLNENAVIEDREIELDVPDKGKRRMLLSARQWGARGDYDLAILARLEDPGAKSEIDALKVALRDNQDMLRAEVHHRVANSLQIIASILLLKARSVQSEETRVHLRDVHHRLLSVATVQRQLSVSTPGNDVEFGPYLKALCEGLATSMIGDDRAVEIASSATDGAIKSEDAVSFGLIVTELVINSLKHGFPNGRRGRIVVGYVMDQGGWRLTVSDDGVGRPAILPGQPDHVGLGTSIVEALARSLDATVEISAASPGARTTILHAV